MAPSLNTASSTMRMVGKYLAAGMVWQNVGDAERVGASAALHRL